MDREDILSKARTENNGKDYYELEISSRADSIAWIVALLICAVMIGSSIVLSLFDIRDVFHFHELYLVIFIALACKHFYCYAKIKNRKLLIIGILCVLAIILDVVSILFGDILIF